MIPFNIPPYAGSEKKYLFDAIKGNKLSGDGPFTKKCSDWFEKKLGCKRALLTTSCTHALEMSALLIDIKKGDEVIMPSYTFVSTANAFVLRGAKIVFVDIRPDTMNIDENLIEPAITKKTKAIVPVHCAGVSCEMGKIISIANNYNLFVIEDAAHGVMARYKRKNLGTLGHLGTYSFHDTKNYTSGGEGGLLIINDQRFKERAEFIREKGTNRNKFLRGQVDKYTWVDIGSSYLPSELNAAYLWGQLQCAEKINKDRLSSWSFYYENLKELKEKGEIELPVIPQNCIHNAHIFYIKTKNIKERTRLMNYLQKKKIFTAFHYIPLHSSPAGKKYGKFFGKDKFTTKESERILRLPIWYGLPKKNIKTVCNSINSFYLKK